MVDETPDGNPRFPNPVKKPILVEGHPVFPAQPVFFGSEPTAATRIVSPIQLALLEIINEQGTYRPGDEKGIEWGRGWGVDNLTQQLKNGVTITYQGGHSPRRPHTQKIKPGPKVLSEAIGDMIRPPKPSRGGLIKPLIREQKIDGTEGKIRWLTVTDEGNDVLTHNKNQPDKSKAMASVVIHSPKIGPESEAVGR